MEAKSPCLLETWIALLSEPIVCCAVSLALLLRYLLSRITSCNRPRFSHRATVGPTGYGFLSASPL